MDPFKIDCSGETDLEILRKVCHGKILLFYKNHKTLNVTCIYSKASVNTVEITQFFRGPSYFGTNLGITQFLDKFSVSMNILKNHYT